MPEEVTYSQGSLLAIGSYLQRLCTVAEPTANSFSNVRCNNNLVDTSNVNGMNGKFNSVVTFAWSGLGDLKKLFYEAGYGDEIWAEYMELIDLETKIFLINMGGYSLDGNGNLIKGTITPEYRDQLISDLEARKDAIYWSIATKIPELKLVMDRFGDYSEDIMTTLHGTIRELVQQLLELKLTPKQVAARLDIVVRVVDYLYLIPVPVCYHELDWSAPNLCTRCIVRIGRVRQVVA